MKESAFINKNKENWKHFEEVLKGNSSEPDELNDLFIQVTDDLSYARSFYPNRSVRVYLNDLAQKVYLKLYTNRKRKQSYLSKFFKDELPAIMFSARKELLICFLVFLLTFIVGVFSSRHNANFARQILGEQYVEMTNQNIKNGKPMGVYSQGNNLEHFFAIAYNNLRVDMLTFATGLMLSIGTLFVLAYNGVMVGVFQYFFYGTGYFTLTILTIWLHGTLEIFTMILSATAGLIFGKGLIFPGTFRRLQAFRLSALKGVKIILAVIPLTLTAAFIEAFVTGQSQTPLIIKGSLILVSLIFILFYFLWFPYFKFAHTGKEVEMDDLPPETPVVIELDQIKTIGDVVADSFRVWKLNLRFIIIASLILGIALVLSVYLTESRHLEYAFFGVPNSFFTLVKLLKLNLWFRDGYYIIWPVLIPTFSLFVVFIQSRFFKKYLLYPAKISQNTIRFFLNALIISLCLTMFYLSDGFLFFMLFYFVVFPLALSLTSSIFDKGLKGLNTGFGIAIRTFLGKLLLNLSLLFLCFIIYLLVSSPILNFIIEILSKGLRLSDPMLFEIQKVIIIIIGLSTLFALITLNIYANSLHYFSSKEKITAKSLRTELEKLWV